MNENEIRRLYLAAYRLLNRVNVLDMDCGTVCGAACCQSDAADEEMGIFLLPGEELLHEDADEDNFISCSGPENCDRAMRPMQCRTFPLMPYINESGSLEILYDDNELPYACPLIEDEVPLNNDFVRATATVWKHLLRDRRIYDLVWQDSEDIRRS